MAIIVSAIFWSWLWGPLGLMLSTPLTVCLVVLGRYVPEFSFLDVLLKEMNQSSNHRKSFTSGCSPAATPTKRLTTPKRFLEEEYLIDYYEKVGLPALILGEADRQRGVMTEAQIALPPAPMPSLKILQRLRAKRKRGTVGRRTDFSARDQRDNRATGGVREDQFYPWEAEGPWTMQRLRCYRKFSWFRVRRSDKQTIR